KNRERLRTGAKIFVLIGKISPLADQTYGESTLQPALPDAGVQHRRFLARVRADDDEAIRLIDTGQAGIENIARAAGPRIKLYAIGAAVEQMQPEALTQEF